MVSASDEKSETTYSDKNTKGNGGNTKKPDHKPGSKPKSRLGLREAKELTKGHSAISHLRDNEDETYSVVVHSKKETCAECQSQGDCSKIDDPKAVVIREKKPVKKERRRKVSAK